MGPLVLVWNDPEPEPKLLDTSIIEHDKDMDIKSIDSESPTNGEFEQMGKMSDTINTSSDEQLSSLEMIDDTDEDTVKIEH